MELIVISIILSLVIFLLLAYSVYKDREFKAERHDLLLKIMAKNMAEYERVKVIETPPKEHKKSQELDDPYVPTDEVPLDILLNAKDIT